ncbi:MAG: nucleoside-triphosphate diphosphatase [Gammaproteobacteria bacterium]|jgi:XTP/dITP diphosphohydrolase|nr:nucleoside-triphosphate diphosphatase [Gammaproteobacteria bacterium]
MKKIYLATHNKGKQKELGALLKDSGFVCVFPEQDDAPDETASTFVENALIKARHGCLQSGLATLADDAGLVIPALNGAPGIFSARYAGEHGNNNANIEKVLQEMQGKKNRQAYFCCVLVVLRAANDPCPLIAQGIWQGEILTEPRGENGFGYDPIFLCPEKNCSVAELDASTKNQLSHRGKALQLLKQTLPSLLL